MTGHLLHVGYPKTGSTFLQRWFAAHPQLAYVEGGIAGFRDVYSIAAENAADNTVEHDPPLYRVTSAEVLTAPIPDAGRAVIEYERVFNVRVATAQLQVCATLASLFPNATVLIVTRGFRSMILSTLSQYARTGGEVDLLQMVRTAHEQRDPRWMQSWDYDMLIAAYQHAFGTDNVLVLPYELLRDDTSEFLRTLAARLGIDPFRAEEERINESLSPVELYWYPRLTRMVRRIPAPRLRAAYGNAALRNRLRRPIAMLQRLRPGIPFTAESIPDGLVDLFRGRAESLRGNPLFAPYAADYLHDSSAEAGHDVRAGQADEEPRREQ